MMRAVPAPPSSADLRDLRVEKFLIAGRRHFELGREVDPELDDVEEAAALGESGAVKFFVDDARGGGHPLDVAGADFAVVAAGVAVLELAGIDDRDGFKAAMGMLADATRGGAGRELVRAGVVEEQERVDRGRVATVGEEAANGKAVADPMLRDVADDVDEFLHGASGADDERTEIVVGDCNDTPAEAILPLA